MFDLGGVLLSWEEPGVNYWLGQVSRERKMGNTVNLYNLGKEKKGKEKISKKIVEKTTKFTKITITFEP